MSKHIIKGYVTYEAPSYAGGLPVVSFQTWKPNREYTNAVMVREHSIEVDVPDNFDPRPQLINGLQEQQKKARADFENLCTDIQRQISELTCLEMSA